MGYNDRREYEGPYHEAQKHVHEVQGSVKTAGEDPHEHRFCTVTSEPIPYGNNDHVHDVVFRTDYHDGHYHEFKGKTGCAIPVGNRHIHYLDSITSVDAMHRHSFECATLIENPTGNDKEDIRNETRYDNRYNNKYGTKYDRYR